MLLGALARYLGLARHRTSALVPAAAVARASIDTPARLAGGPVVDVEATAAAVEAAAPGLLHVACMKCLKRVWHPTASSLHA